MGILIGFLMRILISILIRILIEILNGILMRILMGILMMDSKVWPYDSSDCLLLIFILVNIYSDKVLELVNGGSVTNGDTLSSFSSYASYLIHHVHGRLKIF